MLTALVCNAGIFHTKEASDGLQDTCQSKCADAYGVAHQTCWFGAEPVADRCRRGAGGGQTDEYVIHRTFPQRARDYLVLRWCVFERPADRNNSRQQLGPSVEHTRHADCQRSGQAERDGLEHINVAKCSLRSADPSGGTWADPGRQGGSYRRRRLFDGVQQMDGKHRPVVTARVGMYGLPTATLHGSFIWVVQQGPTVLWDRVSLGDVQESMKRPQVIMGDGICI